MSSLGATRGARPRAHVGVALATALIVFVLIGLMTATQAPPWRSIAARAPRDPHTAVPIPARPIDVLIARSALREDVDATADSLDDASSNAVLPGTAASPRAGSRTIAVPPVAFDPISPVWWAATAARAPPDADIATSGYLHPIG